MAQGFAKQNARRQAGVFLYDPKTIDKYRSKNASFFSSVCCKL